MGSNRRIMAVAVVVMGALGWAVGLARAGDVWNVSLLQDGFQMGQYTSIAILPSGKQVISHYDNINGDLKYAELVGSDPADPDAWVTTTIDSDGDVGAHTSLAILPSGAASSSGSTQVFIEPTAGIYLAGRTDIIDLPWGTTFPPELVAAPADTWTFENAIGEIDFFNGTGNFFGPDGNGLSGSDLSGYDGISGFLGPQGPIVGVFLDGNIPDEGPAPDTLDFTPTGFGTAFLLLEPELGQMFFIGDGLDGTGAGVTQTFIAPPGATRLFLGIADGGSEGAFQGFPCCYGDNDGSYQIDAIRVPAGDPQSNVIFVDASATGANDGSSWSDAFNDLQAGLDDAAGSGEPIMEIWVSVGTYTPTEPGGDRTATFQLLNGVALYGGFDGTESTLEDRAGLFDQTILSGDLDGDDGPDFSFREDNSLHVIWAGAVGPSTVLDGFEIRGGNADGESSTDSRGGGARITNGAPTFRNCKFTDNRCDASGGALFAHGGNPLIQDCIFIANEAGSRGGGVSFLFESAPLIINCSFLSNRAVDVGGDGGAMGLNNGHPVVINCLFALNSNGLPGGALGGAIYANGTSKADFVNCTWFGNVSNDGLGGAIYVRRDAEANLINCIAWENGPNALFEDVSENGVIHADFSIVEGGWPGEDNWDTDPFFVNEAASDFRLGPGSPAIDCGKNSAVPADTQDLDGDGNTSEPIPFDLDGGPRFIDDPNTPDCGVGTPPIVDRGAYEYHLAGNCDLDWDVDLADFATFSICALGPNVPVTGDCVCVDMDHDGDVDLVDVAMFQAAFTGDGG